MPLTVLNAGPSLVWSMMPWYIPEYDSIHYMIFDIYIYIIVIVRVMQRPTTDIDCLVFGTTRTDILSTSLYLQLGLLSFGPIF